MLGQVVPQMDFATGTALVDVGGSEEVFYTKTIGLYNDFFLSILDPPVDRDLLAWTISMRTARMYRECNAHCPKINS